MGVVVVKILKELTGSHGRGSWEESHPWGRTERQSYTGLKGLCAGCMGALWCREEVASGWDLNGRLDGRERQAK